MLTDWILPSSRRLSALAVLASLVLVSCGGGAPVASAACNAQGLSGGTDDCSVDSDCANSIAAAKYSRAGPIDVWCNKGKCFAAERLACEAVRSDFNPCPSGEFCAPLGQYGTYCTLLPIDCSDVANCPAFRPLDSNGVQADWSCASGICWYPGLEYTCQ